MATPEVHLGTISAALTEAHRLESFTSNPGSAQQERVLVSQSAEMSAWAESGHQWHTCRRVVERPVVGKRAFAVFFSSQDGLTEWAFDAGFGEGALLGGGCVWTRIVSGHVGWDGMGW